MKLCNNTVVTCFLSYSYICCIDKSMLRMTTNFNASQILNDTGQYIQHTIQKSESMVR